MTVLSESFSTDNQPMQYTILTFPCHTLDYQ